jgi:hypothetical protein
MDQFQDYVPFVLLFAASASLGYFARKEMLKQEKEWKEEEARKARIRDLSPQPSYEERMGVQYGPTGSQNE